MGSHEPLGAAGLLSTTTWFMHPGERAALEGLLVSLRPALSVEIGTYLGGSLDRIAAHSEEVHAFDLRFQPGVTQERYPNVHFHEGDCHALLPRVLAELAAAGRNLDFALVDGDHSAIGVKRDVLDLLESPITAKSVIVLHDTLSERVRQGLEDIDFSEHSNVSYVDFDFVAGNVRCEGQSADDLWCGLGLIVTGVEVEHKFGRTYPAPAVFDAFARARAEAGHPRPGDRQILNLERDLERKANLIRLMQSSWSWRLTAPLRGSRFARRPRASGQADRSTE